MQMLAATFILTKMSVQTAAVLLMISVAIPCTLGVFDGRDGSGPRPGDQFPVTGNLLQCHGTEPDVPLTVGVGVIPGEVFKPAQSRSSSNAYSYQCVPAQYNLL